MSAADLRGLAERAGAADLERDVQRLERRRVGRDPILLLAREDQEVAELAAAGIDLAADVPRDAIRRPRRPRPSRSPP